MDCPTTDTSSDGMRIMIAGDTHGDIEWCAKLTRAAGRSGATKVIQVGDFGFWPRMRTSSGRSHTTALFETIGASCERFGVTEWIVLDGNHEDHSALRVHLNHRDDHGFVTLSEHVRYVPRGHRFSFEGVSFGALGGAVSLDAFIEAAGHDFGSPPYRPGWDWFPELEAPSHEDVARLGSEPLDVLLTHEAPSGIALDDRGGLYGIYIPPEIAERSERVRRLVSEAIVATRPKIVVHGHWHYRYNATLRVPGQECWVEGLASNSLRGGRDGRAYLFLDLPSGEITDGRHAQKLLRQQIHGDAHGF